MEPCSPWYPAGDHVWHWKPDHLPCRAAGMCIIVVVVVPPDDGVARVRERALPALALYRTVKIAREEALRRFQSCCVARRRPSARSGRRGGGEACVGARISLAQGFIPDGEAEAATSKQEKVSWDRCDPPWPSPRGDHGEHGSNIKPHLHPLGLGPVRSARHVIMEAKTKTIPPPQHRRGRGLCRSAQDL